MIDLRSFGPGLALVLTLGLTGIASTMLPGCGGNCQSRRDCDEGQFCQFSTGDCIDGCTGPQDCAPTAQCDRSTGTCRPTLVEPADAGLIPDAGTSTVPDAGS